MNQAESAKVVPVFAGVVVGVLMFTGLSLWFGRDFIPSVENLPTYPKPAPVDLYHPAVAAPAGPTDPGEQVFSTVCATCHQANAQGLAGTFPPLAGSSWASGDVETPIRIVIAGLGGPIEVSGQQFNSMMPPPPGVSTDDEKIAAVLTYVRSHFGNKGSAVDKAKVAEVRASMAARTTTWTAAELTALRPAAAGAAATPTPAAAGAAAPAPTPAAEGAAGAVAAPTP